MFAQPVQPKHRDNSVPLDGPCRAISVDKQFRWLMHFHRAEVPRSHAGQWL